MIRIAHPRWLLSAAALAVMTPMAVTASAASTMSSALAAQRTARAGQQEGPPRPVIDNGYMYAQLYHMATSFIYRVAGADGPPQDPSSPYNLPPTVNGANEFYAYWKQQMTDPAPGAMGPMGRFVTATDNFFALPRGGLPFDGDVAEVTIPGASCPGERALISGHNDSTPTSTRMATSAAQGDYTGVSNRMHVGNMGNGSPFDATSGEAMGMAEFQALLRWYQRTGTWPKRTIKVGLFDAEETGLQGSSYYAANLIPAGPQGKYVMVANMDQNGIEYPAYHWGTDHYLNNLSGGGVGPWYTNINAVPLSPNSIYPADSQAWANIQANMPAEIAFRQALGDSVTQAFSVLGRKYGFSVPLENPERYDQVGSTPVSPGPKVMPAYTPEDQAKYSPVVDDALGRTDQVSFINQGIPGFGVVGAYDSSNSAVGGFENPYPAFYTSKPTLAQYAGYDTTNDTIANLNFWASGTVHGSGGPTSPSTELIRGLELPATWTAYLIQRDAYGGDAPAPTSPVAYFETSPVQPKTTLTVTFNAAFSRSADGGRKGLEYFWDFGDGTTALGGPVVTHTYSAPLYADVKLAVFGGGASGGPVSGDAVGTYRQAVPVGFDPAAAGSPPPPATDPCGTLTAGERAAIIAQAQQAAGQTPAAAPAMPG
jgi:PKD domain/Peptidase family M28